MNRTTANINVILTSLCIRTAFLGVSHFKLQKAYDRLSSSKLDILYGLQKTFSGNQLIMRSDKITRLESLIWPAVVRQKRVKSQNPLKGSKILYLCIHKITAAWEGKYAVKYALRPFALLPLSWMKIIWFRKKGSENHPT